MTLDTSGSNGTISSVNWGDGTIDSLTTHTYTSAGAKSITLNIFKNGQTASVTHSITLYNYPISGTVKIGGVGLGNVTITLTGAYLRHDSDRLKRSLFLLSEAGYIFGPRCKGRLYFKF